MVARYFAYGSNMNPQRVKDRGIRYQLAMGAVLDGYALVFDKTSRNHAGLGHANLVVAPAARVEGVLYWLDERDEIRKMDKFEHAPVNYSREIVRVRIHPNEIAPGVGEGLVSGDDGSGTATTWTYFANPAVRRPGLLPPRSYLKHLLAGEAFLSADYYQRLVDWPCSEDSQ